MDLRQIERRFAQQLAWIIHLQNLFGIGRAWQSAHHEAAAYSIVRLELYDDFRRSHTGCMGDADYRSFGVMAKGAVS